MTNPSQAEKVENDLREQIAIEIFEAVKNQCIADREIYKEVVKDWHEYPETLRRQARAAADVCIKRITELETELRELRGQKGRAES